MQAMWPASWRYICRHVFPSLLISGVGPIVVYALLRPHMTDMRALLVTLLIPLGEGAFTLLRHRRLNVFGIIVAASIALGVITAFVSGSPRILLARESLLSGAFGLLMLLSLLCKQPLVYYIAGHFVAGHDQERLHDYRRKGRSPWIRRFFRLLTAVWGGITLGDALVNTYLAFHLSIPTYLIVTPIARYSVMGVALAWTLIYAYRGRYIGHLLAHAGAGGGGLTLSQAG
jgi:hypothetical protein